MINVFTLTNINTKKIERNNEHYCYFKGVYQTSSPAH